jgi:hypothetical protein
MDLPVPLSLLLKQNSFSILLLASASSKHTPVISVFVRETQFRPAYFARFLVLTPDPLKSPVLRCSRHFDFPFVAEVFLCSGLSSRVRQGTAWFSIFLRQFSGWSSTTQKTIKTKTTSPRRCHCHCRRILPSGSRWHRRSRILLHCLVVILSPERHIN